MLELDKIIASYERDWHNVEGLYIQEVQSLTQGEILEILQNARGRDIIIAETWQDDDMRDGQWYKYDWSEDPNFDIEKYL